MSLLDTLGSVRHTLLQSPLRTALTLLGMMIGAGSIVLVASLLHGGEAALNATAQEATEADLIRIHRKDPPPKESRKTARELSSWDAQVLSKSRLLAGSAVGTERSRDLKANWRGHTKRVGMVGTSPVAEQLYRLEIEQGRFLVESDLAERRRVCVVGQEVWQELLKKTPISKDLFVPLEGELWAVVGVLKSKMRLGAGDGTWMVDRRVYVPETTFDALFSPEGSVDKLLVRAGSLVGLTQKLAVAKQVISQTLLRRHFGVHNFKIERQGENSQQSKLILLVIQALLLGTGMLAMFVGGINIMNIMLVSVTERTREIGVRRALGATPGAIRRQFLLEASLLATCGGLAGVCGGALFGRGAAFLLQRTLGVWDYHIAPWSIACGIGLSLVTGILFGLAPAWRASRLNPVEALRFE